MKLDMFEDEFDQYFARAALQELEATQNRRGSLPIPVVKSVEHLSCCPRRTGSLKYPPVKNRAVSPRLSPHRHRPGTESPLSEGEKLYATETTLRAPSPRLGVKCASAPHSRSSSWKKAKRPRSRTDLDQLDPRPRTASVPNEETLYSKLEKLQLPDSDELQIVRTFVTSSKGIENRGDSFKRKSTSSVASEAGSCGSTAGPEEHRSRACSTNSDQGSNCLSAASSTGFVIFRSLMLGATGVGKTSLTQQFMTSEYMGAADSSFDNEGERSVSVLLDGQETSMDIIDAPAGKVDVNFADVDAFVVVYSITDVSTFKYAVEMLREIRADESRHPALILVANKSDLVRTRQVSEEDGKEMATKYDCKYIEVSAVLNHMVDELLVGVVRQIRLNPKRDEARRKRDRQTKTEGACAPKGLIGKLFRRQSTVSKSCDNLLVL